MKGDREEINRRISKSHSKRCCCFEIKANVINLPLDIIIEILKKLPVKSLVRFQCVSKQWSTLIGHRKDFIDLIVARPLPQRRCDLHFIFHHCSPEPFFFFSSTYNHKEQDAVAMPRRCQYRMFDYQYVRGLVCCSSLSSNDLIRIYNPTTKQTISLPEIKSPSNNRYCFFGYDPVMNQYKVMCMIIINGLRYQSENVCQVFTLQDPMKQWRKVQGIENHSPLINGVHINGTVYFRAITRAFSEGCKIVSFDFRSETFDYIKIPKALECLLWSLTLVNYKGKLGILSLFYNSEMWVMENAEKQEWSRTILYFPKIPIIGLVFHRFSGITLRGEIFITKLEYKRNNDPLYIYYYEPQQHSFRRAEIENTIPFNNSLILVGVPDHVENTMRL